MKFEASDTAASRMQTSTAGAASGAEPLQRHCPQLQQATCHGNLSSHGTSWEPEENVLGNHALADWQNLQQQEGAKIASVTQRPDHTLGNMQKQSIYGDNPYISHLQQAVRHKLHLEHQPIHRHNTARRVQHWDSGGP